MIIYVLELEQGKYYVGKTTKCEKRIQDHINNLGAEYTKKYKPIKIEKIILNCDDYDEDKYVRIYMDKYGIDNVRGGSFCNEFLTSAERNVLLKSNKNTHNLCFKCNNKGHFAKQCPKNITSKTTNEFQIQNQDLINYFKDIKEKDNELENYKVENNKLNEQINKVSNQIKIIKRRKFKELKEQQNNNNKLNERINTLLEEIKTIEYKNKIKTNTLAIDYEYELVELDKEIEKKNIEIQRLKKQLLNINEPQNNQNKNNLEITFTDIDKSIETPVDKQIETPVDKQKETLVDKPDDWDIMNIEHVTNEELEIQQNIQNDEIDNQITISDINDVNKTKLIWIQHEKSNEFKSTNNRTKLLLIFLILLLIIFTIFIFNYFTKLNEVNIKNVHVIQKYFI